DPRPPPLATPSLHDALPISASPSGSNAPAGMPALPGFRDLVSRIDRDHTPFPPSATNFWLKVDGFDLRSLVSALGLSRILPVEPDRKSTRLNSSHVSISYAV